MDKTKLLTAEEARKIVTETRNKQSEEQLARITEQINQKVFKVFPESRLIVPEKLMTATAAVLMKNGYKLEEKVNPMEGYTTIISW